MHDMEIDKKLRVFILDTLVSKSGQQLTPDIIGQLTTEILERVLDVIAKGEHDR